MERCGAKLRGKDQYCRKYPMKGKTRCERHGGGTPRGFLLPHTTTGRHSKDLPTRLTGRYLESLRDPDLLNLTDEIALTDSLIEDARRGLDHGESGRLFRELGERWDDYLKAQRVKDGPGVQIAIAEMGALIRQGLGAYAAREETMTLVEKRRRLVESEHRRRVAMQDMITSEKAVLFVSALLDAVTRHVHDVNVLAAISAEFGVLTSLDDHHQA